MATNFGVWLESKMDEADLNLTGLALKLGLTHPSVRQWITGETKPSPANARKLSRVLGVTVAEIYDALGLVPSLANLPPSKRQIIDLLLEAPADPQTYRAIRAMLLALRDESESE